MRWRWAPPEGQIARRARGRGAARTAQPLEPKPRASRSLGWSASTSTSATAAKATTSSWAMRSPAATSKAASRVGVQQQHAQLTAVAGVDQAGRVDERDPVAQRRARSAAATRPAWPSGIATAMPVPTLARSPAASRAAWAA